jgi:hypothetical protein
MGLCAAAVMARRATMAATTAKRAITSVVLASDRWKTLPEIEDLEKWR